jgi:ParB-like chromosome segregation protein Spo0J
MSTRRKRSSWVEIPIEQVRIEEPLHQADWPRRAEVVPAFENRVAITRERGSWPGDPIRVQQQGDHYTLVAGFSRLAVALEAGLDTARVIIEPQAQQVVLAEIHLRPWQEKARLNAKKLAERREQARRIGSLPVPLQVRPARKQEPAGFILLDGLYWYHIAREMVLETVPAIVRS